MYCIHIFFTATAYSVAVSMFMPRGVAARGIR